MSSESGAELLVILSTVKVVSRVESKNVLGTVSPSGCLSAAAGLKAWVTEGRVGAVTLMQPSTAGKLLRDNHFPTSALIPVSWTLHLLRNWKIHK